MQNQVPELRRRGTGPTSTGSTSLTSTVKRWLMRAWENLSSGLKNVRTTSQQSASGRQIGLYCTLIVSRTILSASALENTPPTWNAFVAA